MCVRVRVCVTFVCHVQATQKQQDGAFSLLDEFKLELEFKLDRELIQIQIQIQIQI